MTIEKKPYWITIYTLIFILVFMVFFQSYFRYWNSDKGETPFQWDVEWYYCYLPATIIYHDLDFKYTNRYWLQKTSTGKQIPKMTCGVAIMMAPFFLLGHKIAINEKTVLDGYSEPYGTCVHYGSLFYTLMGLIILAFVLRRHLFSDGVTALTLATVFAATNLFFYTLREGEMSHSYEFFLISLFLWLTCKWHEKQKSIYFLWLGMTIGLASLVRPTEILIVLIFIFYKVHSFSDLTHKFKQVVFSFKNIPFLLLGFLLLWLPQLLFWKMQTGHFLFFSYGKERFFWTDPQVINVLFSYRKGWFIYTPVMLFAIAGIFMLRDKAKDFKFSVIIYLIINIYVISCWWCWWYGGSYGMRALVDCYGLMAIPMAAFYQRVFSINFKKQIFTFALRNFVMLSLATFLSLNIIQTIQYNSTIIHFQSMTKKAYWHAFGKFSFTAEDWERQRKELNHPDMQAAMRGEKRN